MNKEITEKCGVFAMIGNDLDPQDFRDGFSALQHRGKDAAGALLVSPGQTTLLQAEGKIESLFQESHDHESGFTIFLGHNRYSTSAGLWGYNIQPLLFTDGDFSLALDHNGNIPELGLSALQDSSQNRLSSKFSDSAFMVQTLMRRRRKCKDWNETFIETLPLFQGAFSLACVTEEGELFIARDPWGIRPLCLGRKGGAWIAASESTALTAMGAEYLREVLPGELIRINSSGEFASTIYGSAAKTRPCLLETIYFSKRDSFDGQQFVWEKRRRMGRLAAKRFLAKGIEIDLVVPILNSGLEMAIGAAQELKRAHVEAISVRGEERSFIQNSKSAREGVVHNKHVIDGKRMKGKRVLLCDDSLVRGTSLKGLVQKIRDEEDQPSEIHILLGSEPVTSTCDLGVDLPKLDELLAGNLGDESLAEIESQVAQVLEVDSVTYMDAHSVEASLAKLDNEMCRHCFGGSHPLHDSAKPIYRATEKDKLKQQGVIFMASGNGTNVEELLSQMRQETILAKPLGVITNNPMAGVIEKAKRKRVPTQVVASKGRLKNGADRRAYEAELLKIILENPQGIPDVIVLAGWMLVLSDEFIKPLTERGIHIINLHPALLSGMGADFVGTSKGKVPELRGAHAIADAYALPISQMPVSGVTVHEVLPQGGVDTGRVIIREEVTRRPGEGLEDFEARMHDTEHRIFAIALQKVLLEIGGEK